MARPKTTESLKELVDKELKEPVSRFLYFQHPDGNITISAVDDLEDEFWINALKNIPSYKQFSFKNNTGQGFMIEANPWCPEKVAYEINRFRYKIKLSNMIKQKEQSGEL
jgi:hypothetical protein